MSVDERIANKQTNKKLDNPNWSSTNKQKNTLQEWKERKNFISLLYDVFSRKKRATFQNNNHHHPYHHKCPSPIKFRIFFIRMVSGKTRNKKDEKKTTVKDCDHFIYYYVKEFYSFLRPSIHPSIYLYIHL